MTTVTSPATDPLSVFLKNAHPRDKVPVPLQSTAFDITIDSGLALVQTTRLFRNKEDKTIEATLTFPVPIHAVLFSLEVKIGERQLQATARAKETAREAYEEGIEDGKTSILHEELLRGIHMLSVGNIPPGEEIEVKTVWAMPLMMAGGEGHLRIPTTVGQIYGQSPLADGDDFTWGDEIPLADITVSSAGATVKIGGRIAGVQPVQVRMNQPIDLAVGEWQPEPLLSRTADGAEIMLELSPAPTDSAALSLAILVDHSGSMEDSVPQGESGTSTVHELVLSALKVLSGQLAKDDFVDLWEFSNFARHVGLSSGNQPSLQTLVKQLSSPDGGTEINASLSTVLGITKAHSVLLITDGKSHALDVQALAGRGKRLSVLLVGEDSLEAQVGHLAALTRGDIFVAPKNAVDKVLGAALCSLRFPSNTMKSEQSATGASMDIRLSGMVIRLRLGDRAEPAERSTLEHGIAAVSASLQLHQFSEIDAARLAAAEGLVTHLTSLVLVDEAVSVQDGIPMRRRVPLAPSLASPCFAGRPHISASVVPSSPSRRMYLRTSDSSSLQNSRYPSAVSFVGNKEPGSTFRANIDALADLIDWDEFGDALAQRQIDRLDEETAADIHRLANSPTVKKLADERDVDVLFIIVILLASRRMRTSRSAFRVLRHLRANLAPDLVDSIMELDPLNVI